MAGWPRAASVQKDMAAMAASEPGLITPWRIYQ